MSTTETSTDTAAAASLPSGSPVPVGTGVPAPKASPLPAIPVGAVLAALPSNIDAFIAHLNKCFSTPSGIDTVLLFVTYASRLSAAGLTALSASALRRSARDWLALVSSLPPRTTILFTASDNAKLPRTGSAAAAAALVLAQRLRSLATLLAEVRTALRLWGLLSMYLWGRRLVLKALAARRARATAGEKPSSSQETLADTAVAWGQFLSIAAYQVLENGAYLSSKGVLGWSKPAQGRAAKWSVRFWALFVGLELGRLAADGLRDGTGGRIQKTAAEKQVWQKAVVRNLAWAPLTVHWSVDKGFIGDNVIALLGSIPGTIQMWDLWKETA